MRAAVEEALSRSADAAVAEARAFAAAGQALAGDLDAISMSEVLELLAEQGQSGILRVVNTETNARIEIYFRGGRVDFAAAVGVADEFLLGRFVVDDGDLTPEALDQVLAEREQSRRAAVPLFGADLIARGLVTREALTRAMVRQTSELAYEALRWRAGFFQFRRTDELSLLARDAALQINVDRMLLEGYRRVDEWRIIEREISNFDEVFVRNDDKIADTPRGTFTRDELAVLEQIDGRQIGARRRPQAAHGFVRRVEDVLPPAARAPDPPPRPPDGVALMSPPAEINPYAPPATDGENLPPVAGEGAFARALFSPRQILAATVFGSIISGLILLQANFRAMDRARDANRTVLFGLLASAALFALLFMLPARIPATPVNIAAALAFYKLAETMQGKAFFKHRAAGGARQSNWLVFGITLGTAVVLLVTLF